MREARRMTRYEAQVGETQADRNNAAHALSRRLRERNNRQIAFLPVAARTLIERFRQVANRYDSALSEIEFFGGGSLDGVARIDRAKSVEEAVQRLLPVSRKPGTGGPRSAEAVQYLREQNRLNELLDLRLQKTRASIKVTSTDAWPSLDRDAVNLLVREHGTALAAVRQARDMLKSASPAQAVVILRFFAERAKDLTVGSGTS